MRLAMTACTLSGMGSSPLDSMTQASVGLAQRAPLDQHPAVLVGVERHPVGQLDQRAQQLRREGGLRRTSARRGSAIESSRSGVSEIESMPGTAPAQRRLALEQLRPGGADHEQRHVPDRRADQLDEAEHAVVGPVQVLEDEHGRTARGQREQEPPPGRLGVLSGQWRAGQARAAGRSASDSRADSPAGTRSLQRRVEAVARGLGGVGGQHAGLRLHDVGQRGVGDVLAERRAATAAPADPHVDQLPGVLVQLPDQPALADAGPARAR